MPDFQGCFAHPRPIVSSGADSLSLYFKKDQLQSQMSIQRPHQLELPYTKTMMGFLLFNPEPVHILMIGLGGGSMVKFFHQHLRQTCITVVEINPHVVSLRDQFLVPPDDDRLQVICADGADFMCVAQPEFDVVLVDGFDELGQSVQLSSMAFYAHCRRVLLPSGVLAVNLDGEHPGHAAFLQRLETVFSGHLLEVPVSQRSNHIVFATKDGASVLDDLSLHRAIAHQTDTVRAQLEDDLLGIVQLQHARRTDFAVVWPLPTANDAGIAATVVDTRECGTCTIDAMHPTNCQTSEAR